MFIAGNIISRNWRLSAFPSETLASNLKTDNRLQFWTKCLEQSKETKQNWSRILRPRTLNKMNLYELWIFNLIYSIHTLFYLIVI